MYILPKFFTEEQLCLLDAEDDDIDRLVAHYERKEKLARGNSTMNLMNMEVDDVVSGSFDAKNASTEEKPLVSNESEEAEV
jgi:hypothetical protein